MKESLKEHLEDIKYYSELAGLGSLGSLVLYAATKVEEYELSLVGKEVGGYLSCSVGGAWGGGGICVEVSRRIMTLTEAMTRIQADYIAIGIDLLALTVMGAFLVINNRNKKGESQ